MAQQVGAGAWGKRLGALTRCDREAEGKEHAGEGNWCRQADPTGQRERGGSAHGEKPPLTGGTHLSGSAGARARGLAGPS
jgi:hypothetical protein